MQMSDVIGDMLTRIKNASGAKHSTVDIPASKMKKAIADILAEEGYIKSSTVIEDGKQGIIRVTLKYLLERRKSYPEYAASPSRVSASMRPLRKCPRLQRPRNRHCLHFKGDYDR